MGTEKALLAFGSGTMLDHMVETLRPVVDEVCVVGGEHLHTDARSIADLHPGLGPLGGLITAFEATKAATLVVVSCDLARLTSDEPAALLQALVASGADYAVPLIAGHRQWHCSVWHQRCAPVLQDAFESGTRSFRSASRELSECAVVFADPKPFEDIDTPEQFASLAQ